MKQKLPIIAMEKLLKSAGSKRVSESAKKKLQDILEKEAHEKSKKAMVFMEHAGRKTVKKEDIELAVES